MRIPEAFQDALELEKASSPSIVCVQYMYVGEVQYIRRVSSTLEGTMST